MDITFFAMLPLFQKRLSSKKGGMQSHAALTVLYPDL